MVSSLKSPIPRLVMVKGTLAVGDGRILVSDLTSLAPGMGRRPFKISQIGRDIFRIAKRNALSAVPVIRIVDQTVMDMEKPAIPVSQDFYRPEDDILLISLVARNGGKIVVVLLNAFVLILAESLPA